MTQHFFPLLQRPVSFFISYTINNFGGSYICYHYDYETAYFFLASSKLGANDADGEVFRWRQGSITQTNGTDVEGEG